MGKRTGRDDMAAKSANLYARIEPDVKEQAEGILATMNAETLDMELEKGYADMQAGRTKSAAQVFADIRRDYNV